MKPCDPIDVTAADGARISLRAHGAHVTGWRPAGGTERLWLSRDTGCGPGVAIRGGVPIIWPQFSNRGPLPRHGLVRDRAWAMVRAGATTPDGAAEAVLRCRDDVTTRASWPHQFLLTVTVRALADQLTITLGCTNEGTARFGFTAALHAYLAVGDLTRAFVGGVGGHRAEDNASGGPLELPDGPLPVTGPVDLAVRDVAGAVTLIDPGLGELTIEAAGLPDVIVWNPGAGQAPGDVHPGGEAQFACVEPAVLTPVVLEPGGSWQATARFRAARA